jgi:hypothetical protein
MTHTCRFLFLCLMFFTSGAWAQWLPRLFQNSDIYLMAGPTSNQKQVIGGTNVTVYGSKGYSTNVGYGYQIMRKSAASLWVELDPGLNSTPTADTASIPGSISQQSTISTLGVRLMIPVESRISFFGAVGGGVGDFENPNLTSDNPPDLKTTDVYHGVFDFGGGVDIRLSRIFSIRVDARDYVTGRDLAGVPGRNHFLPMVGLVFHL